MLGGPWPPGPNGSYGPDYQCILYCTVYSSGSQTFFGKCHEMWHSKGVECQLNIFQGLNQVVNFYLNLYAKFILYTRGVNRAEIFGPSRKLFVRPGPHSACPGWHLYFIHLYRINNIKAIKFYNSIKLVIEYH